MLFLAYFSEVFGHVPEIFEGSGLDVGVQVEKSLFDFLCVSFVFGAFFLLYIFIGGHLNFLKGVFFPHYDNNSKRQLI